MVGISMKMFGTGIKDLTFVRTNYAFGRGEAGGERKRHDLTEGKRQDAKDKWN